MIKLKSVLRLCYVVKEDCKRGSFPMYSSPLKGEICPLAIRQILELQATGAFT